MKMSFRWYGKHDPVTLEKIRQIPGVKTIVTAVYDVAPGLVWSEKSINEIKNTINANGLEFEVVESVPVPEDIKLGNSNADACIANYCENIKRLGRAGVKCVCYNFMPVFDWLRSEMARAQSDGARALAYDHEAVLAMDPQNSELSLPGWDESYTKDQMKELLKAYENVSEEKLWHNLERFLTAVIPVAIEAGVKMAIHPDDPPWNIFGLPRIITCRENICRFLKLYDNNANGITFCTGSLGANPDNDLIAMAREFAPRIHFAHIRNIKHTGIKSFEETAHLSSSGSFDMYGIVKALVSGGFDGYVRPDHGRMIWGEQGKPGYGLFDRALGAAYLNGLFEAAEKEVDNI